MVFVKIRDSESIEEALRRFKRECERNGILKEIRRREYFTAPSVRRKLRTQELQRKLRRLKRRRNRN
jgi:small subunit ribosomal protein S21